MFIWITENEKNADIPFALRENQVIVLAGRYFLGEVEGTPLHEPHKLVPKACKDPLAFLLVINSTFIDKINKEKVNGDWIRNQKMYAKKNDHERIRDQLETFKYFIKD